MDTLAYAWIGGRVSRRELLFTRSNPVRQSRPGGLSEHPLIAGMFAELQRLGWVNGRSLTIDDGVAFALMSDPALRKLNGIAGSWSSFTPLEE